MSKEAMKLALEAFKKLSDYPHAFDECTNAIKALEEALAKQEHFDLNEDLKAWQKDGSPIPAKQEQGEPVAYRLAETDIYDFAGWLTTRKSVMKVGSSCEASPMAEAVGEYLKTFPERFAPQQRTWVGLTDEEVADIERNSITRRQAIRAIEAKLKEKNT